MFEVQFMERIDNDPLIEGKVRNGSCSSLDADGSPYTGVQVNQRFEDRYDVRYQVTAVEGEKHRCMVSIDGMSYFVDVRIRVDLNECEVAAAESVQICQAECHNLFPGYRSPNPDMQLLLRKVATDKNLTYLLSSSTPILYNDADKWIEALGNVSVQVGNKSTSSLFEESEVDAMPVPHFTPSQAHITIPCPGIDLYRTILDTVCTVIWFAVAFLGFHDEVSPENLLQSIDLLLNLHTQEERFEPERNQDTPEVEDASDARKNATAEPLSVSAIVRSALALFDLYSTLSSPNASGSTPSEKLPGEFSVSRHGLELRRIQAQQGDALNESHPVVLQESSNHSDLPATALVMTIPSAKLRPYLPEPAAEAVARGADATSLQSLSELESDLYLIRSSSRDTMVRLKLAASKRLPMLSRCVPPPHFIAGLLGDVRMREVSSACRCTYLQPCGSFPRDACETRWYGGREYVCECLPPHTGTFAVGLVFIINSGNLKNLKKYGLAISVVNYVCSGITIVALSFFLFFTRFVGVFRLDQFHIALCLLLSTIIALFVPHVSEKSVFLCTSVAIFVNFFPLCAFAWKFICGLTALLMVYVLLSVLTSSPSLISILQAFIIVAPYSRFSDLISLRAFYIPASIFAYLFPALIVGFWFGFARQFTSGLGLCIGPDVLGSRWPLLAPITAVVFFNFIVLISVGAVILRSYLATRHTRFTKSTNLLVLIQLMLTLGMPYMLIYVQIISPVIMILILPVGIAVTALFMFLLVAVIDDDNRRLLVVFLQSLRSRKYDPNSENMKNTVVSETITSVDQQMSHNHHFFARSRNHFLRPLPPSMMDDSSNVLVHNSDVYTDGDRPPILVPLEVPSPHRMAMQWDTADCHQPPATSTAALVLPANEKY
ncbi:unnamed protein product [Schistocephalus solidus]|uniref:G_PROTEIN_RECEP_F2_4 domain-containing protein n=1 Tax=Schistocephalus solidus TaxID=70667 RepID=A0A183SDZ2_SCHSO|nr:unnamed protein product [Schistocephalus solidus]